MMERAQTKKIVGKRNLRSLAHLLDDEDPKSFALVSEHILKIGAPMFPYLVELQTSKPALFEKARNLVAEISFQMLKVEFEDFAKAGEKNLDLEAGAFLIARFAHPTFDEKVYRDWLDHVAGKIRADLPVRKDNAAAFKRLHSFLSGAMGFCVNEENYYDPDNNCLNRVIETRRGTPVSLSILFLILARRLKIPAFGIGLPGHFVVGLGAPSLFWDPLLNRVLNIPAMRRRLAQNGFAYAPGLLRPIPSAQILMRLLRNLMAVYETSHSPLGAEKLGELAQILLLSR
jgi:regulator of sirC expression with transglutaminase-like and TPR domain